MENGKPLVTIFTLVYNTGEHVIPALEAIKAQLYRPVEHVIIDDCSKDDSVGIIEAWIAKNNYACKFIKHQQNKGICYSINEAIREANGKYIFGISDDIMFPDKLVNDVKMLEENPDYGMVHSRTLIRYMDRNEEEPLYYKSSESPNPFRDFLRGKMMISAVTVTYRKEVFSQVGYFDEGGFIEDFDMFLRILSKYKVGHIKRFSVIYCRHPKALSTTNYDKVVKDTFRTMQKWKHLPGYQLDLLYRKQYAFYQTASIDKKAALRYFFPSLLLFWRKMLYAGVYKFLFARSR